MKTIIRNSLLSAVALIVALHFPTLAHSQATASSTGYFTDGYIHKHRLNPALTPDRGYVGLPLLNFNTSLGSSLAFSDVFYPDNGSLKSFYSPTSPELTAKMLSRVSDMNRMDFDLENQVLSAGFFNRNGKIFTAISFDVRAALDANLPRGLFEFAKGAGKDGFYDLSGLSAKTTLMSQISVSQSYVVIEGLKVGYRLKFLFGEQNLDVRYDTFRASLTPEQWKVEAKGEIWSEPITFGQTDTPDGRKILDFGKIQTGKFSPFANFGFAADFGASWDVFDFLQVSASVSDLGFLKFNHNQYAVSDHLGQESIDYPDIPDIAGEGGIESLFTKLATLAEFEQKSNSRIYDDKLPVTLRLGAQYRLPVVNRLSVGALYTQQFHPMSPWWEIRGSVNYDALNWLSLSAAYAYGTFKSQLGFLLNIHSRHFNFFVGSDTIPLKYNPQGIPVNAHAVRLNFGINITFGAYRGRYSD